MTVGIRREMILGRTGAGCLPQIGWAGRIILFCRLHTFQILCLTWLISLASQTNAHAQTNTNTGTTGLAWVFANGVVDWNTFQSKALVQVTLHRLGQYDSNGNWVGSNNGLLTGKLSLESLNQFDPPDFGMLWMNNLLCHHRRRSRRSFDRNSQGNCCVASYTEISVTQCGTVFAARVTAQLFVFLGAATTRGPPGFGNQNRQLFHGALGRPARQFCNTPLLPPFSFHDSTSERHAPDPFLQSSFLNGAGALFDPTGFPNKNDPTIHQKELL